MTTRGPVAPQRPFAAGIPGTRRRDEAATPNKADKAHELGPRFWGAVAVWCALLAALVGVGLWVATQSLPEWAGTTVGERLFAMSLVLLLVVTLSFSPVVLFLTFAVSGRHRAKEDVITEAHRHGWDTAWFNEGVDEAHKTVFDLGQYPVPVTLTLITVLLGWVYAFFHDGPSLIADLSTDWKLDSLVAVVTDGPAVLFGFLGAYFFSLVFIFRRYMSGDLGPNAFTHVCRRIWTVVLLTLVLGAVWQGVKLEPPASNASGSTLLAVSFIGGLVPNMLLDVIGNLSKGVAGLALQHKENEVPLAELQGINPWQAARLAEEGVESVQNLAMQDPIRLVVATQEGSFRVLDWIDQALLYNAVANGGMYGKLRKLGIRTGYDLYRVCLDLKMLPPKNAWGGNIPPYLPSKPPADAFDDIAPQTVRNIAANITSHPNFETIRRMREAAAEAVQRLFPLVKGHLVALRRPSRLAAAEVRMPALAWDPPATSPRENLMRHTLAARIGEEQTAVAVAILMAPDTVVTIVDVFLFQDTETLLFTPATPSGWGPAVQGRVLARDDRLRLAAFRLETPVADGVRLAESDPLEGTLLQKYGPITGYAAAAAADTDRTMLMSTGGEDVDVPGLVGLKILPEPGDGGAPAFNEAGNLAGILVAGSQSMVYLVPVSHLRAWLAGIAQADIRPAL